MRIIVTLLCIGLLIIGCKKKAAPKSPEIAVLIFPDRNSECTTGIDLSDSAREVEFRWQAANNTDSYIIRVTNLNENTTQSITTSTTSAKLPLQKGTPYSWGVTSKNDAVVATVQSETWLFYNAGAQTTYAPFPAEIVKPKNGASVLKDINNDVLLKWIGADVDNDIIGFDIYFSTENPPENLIASPSSEMTSIKVPVITNTIYYWRVVTKDTEGNTSDSGVFDFRAI